VISTVKMRVHKYIPSKLFGFCIDPESKQEVFFHLGSFRPGHQPVEKRCLFCSSDGCSWLKAPPPPILGELVEVEVDLSAGKDKAPRAERVTRIGMIKVVEGKVDTFDAHRGYGFVQGDDDLSYHLHKSEILEGRIPTVGQTIVFFAGTRQGRPRACHVKVCG
jgi:cold shock CspA family protein